MKEKFKSFAELNNAVNKDPFAAFLEMTTLEKAIYLKKHGITWGADYLGRYCEKSKSVIIESLENPFTGKAIEGAINNRPSINDGTQIAVRLKTGKIKGQRQTPENIFGFEYLGQLNSKRYIDMTSSALSTTLKEENKKLKSQNDKLHHWIELKDIEISNQKAENHDLKSIIKDLEAENEKLKNEIDITNAVGEKISAELDIVKKEFSDRLSDHTKLAAAIIDRNISDLLHVTSINNLESILNKGIVPVAQLGAEANRNDYERYDRKLECSSLSISKVNSRYFRRIAERDPGQTFICIHLKPSILLDDNTKYYCHHNAATGSISDCTTRGFLTTADDFEYMFADPIEYITIEGKQSRYRTLSHLDRDTTSDQAEILYEGTILPEHFICIAFPTQDALHSSMWLLKRFGVRGIVDYTLRF